MAVDFLVLVVDFFAFGEASGEDGSDDIVILWRKRKQGRLDSTDGRAKVVYQELNIPLLSRRDSESRETCVYLFVVTRT